MMWESPELILEECKRLDKNGSVDEAIELLGNALRDTPSALLYYARAIRFEDIEENERALADYAESIRLKPSVEAFIGRGRLLCDRFGKPQSGLVDFNVALELSPNNSTIHTHLCLCYRMLGWHGEASREARVVVGLEPANASAHILLGQCLIAEKRFDNAANELQTAMSIDPSNADGWSSLSRALRQLGRLEEARACIERALDIDSGPGNLIAFAGLLLELRDAARAIEVLQLAKGYELSEAQSLLVEGYLRLGRNMT